MSKLKISFNILNDLLLEKFGYEDPGEDGSKIKDKYDNCKVDINGSIVSISCREMNIIVNIINSHKYITCINLSGYHLNNDVFNILENFLKNNNQIKELILNNCYLSKDNLSKINNILLVNSSLELLDLSENDINGQDIDILRPAIEKNNSLKSLDLTDNYINSTGLNKLLLSLVKNNSLTFLDLSSNEIEEQDLNNIIPILKKNTTLEVILFDSENKNIDQYLQRNQYFKKIRLLDTLQTQYINSDFLSNLPVNKIQMVGYFDIWDLINISKTSKFAGNLLGNAIKFADNVICQDDEVNNSKNLKRKRSSESSSFTENYQTNIVKNSSRREI